MAVVNFVLSSREGPNLEELGPDPWTKRNRDIPGFDISYGTCLTCAIQMLMSMSIAFRLNYPQENKNWKVKQPDPSLMVE